MSSCEVVPKRLYNQYNWKNASLHFLGENPTCFWCGGFSNVTDHIRPHRGDHRLFLDPLNWQPMCAGCHNLKSWLETKGLACDWDLRSPMDIFIVGEPFSGKTELLQSRITLDHRTAFPFLYKIDNLKDEIPSYRELNGPAGEFGFVRRLASDFKLAKQFGCRLIVKRSTQLGKLMRMTERTKQ